MELLESRVSSGMKGMVAVVQDSCVSSVRLLAQVFEASNDLLPADTSCHDT